MTRAGLKKRLLALPDSVETVPFGPEILVYKVAGKIFALLTAEGEPPRLSLKCDPMRAQHLRAAHSAIVPGWHLNKEHWNTLVLDVTLADGLVLELMEHSWERVVAGLPKKVRTGLLLKRESE